MSKATNIEIKARTHRQAEIRDILTKHQAEFKGIDHQTDTYFVVQSGRLKLRQGNVENTLIFYQRDNQAGPKSADIHLYHPDSIHTDSLKQVLEAALGSWKVVKKAREIYFIENVKFHLDIVEGLGTFVEIEAIDRDGKIGKDTLLKQCNHYMALFDIKKDDLLTHSYSDML